MENKKFKMIIKGSAIAIIITIVALLILSFVLAYTDLKESFAMPIIWIILGCSIIIGSIISSRKVKSNGLINGSIVGFIYIFVLYLLSSLIVRNFALNTYSFIAIAISIITGVIGGIIGVNL